MTPGIFTSEIWKAMEQLGGLAGARSQLQLTADKTNEALLLLRQSPHLRQDTVLALIGEARGHAQRATTASHDAYRSLSRADGLLHDASTAADPLYQQNLLDAAIDNLGHAQWMEEPILRDGNEAAGLTMSQWAERTQPSTPTHGARDAREAVAGISNATHPGANDSPVVSALYGVQLLGKP